MSDVETKPDSAPPPAPEFAAATQPSYIRTLFLGPDGLRPGWGFAFYAVIFYALQWLAVQLASTFGPGRMRSDLSEEFGDLAAAVLPALFLAKVEGRRWGVYGLPVKGAFGRLFWMGSLWGFAAISFLMFSLYGMHGFVFGRVVVHGLRAVRYAAFWAVFFLLVGMFEEFLFRGYSQFTLSRGIGFWPSAIVLSSVFGLVHRGNSGERWIGLVAAAFIGFFFCMTLRRTGNLWFAVGFHAAWDWAESFLYSVPDSGMVAPGHLLSSSPRGPEWLSGGSVGPEGSVLCFIVIAIVWLIFEKTYRNRVVLSVREVSLRRQIPPG